MRNARCAALRAAPLARSLLAAWLLRAGPIASPRQSDKIALLLSRCWIESMGPRSARERGRNRASRLATHRQRRQKKHNSLGPGLGLRGHLDRATPLGRAPEEGRPRMRHAALDGSPLGEDPLLLHHFSAAAFPCCLLQSLLRNSALALLLSSATASASSIHACCYQSAGPRRGLDLLCCRREWHLRLQLVTACCCCERPPGGFAHHETLSL